MDTLQTINISKSLGKLFYSAHSDSSGEDNDFAMVQNADDRQSSIHSLMKSQKMLEDRLMQLTNELKSVKDELKTQRAQIEKLLE